MPQQQAKILLTLAMLVAIALLGVWSLGGLGAPLTDVIGEDVTVTRVLQDGTPTDAAYVSLPYDKPMDDLTVMNVAIDLNGDGVFAAYETEDGETQEEWVIKDHLAKVWGPGNSVGFTLVDRSADDATDLHLAVYLTSEPVDSLDALPRYRAEADMTVSEILTDDFASRFKEGTDAARDGSVGHDASAGTPAGDGPEPGPLATVPRDPSAAPFLSDTTREGDIEGAPEAGVEPAADALPPAGEDFEVFQTDVPDMLQGENECVPTSTSNSLHWLGERFGFGDRLPDTQRETMEELKGDMDWNLEAGGVSTRTDFIPGKTAFVQRHNLPIYTHQIGGELDDDISRKIAVELAKGQAVEVVIGFYAQNEETGEWSRHGGHMMTAVGSWSSNGDTFLGVHDPANANDGRLDIHKVSGKRVFNYPYRGRYQVYIDRAFAESVTEEWIGTHPPQTEIQTGGGMLEAQDLQNVWFIEALRIGNGWYPVRQFHKFTGPECDEDEHWHANRQNAWGLDLSRHSYFETNPETIRARNAPVVEWIDTVDCGAGKTASVEVRSIMISRTEAGALVAQIVE